MEKKKIALTILGLVFTVVGLVCSLIPFFNRIHEKEVYKKELAEAASQAVQYVRDKYGIEPELVDIPEDSWYERNNSNPSVESVIPMKANGKEFYVISRVNGIERGDNYQWNEIEAAIASEIEKIVPSGETIDIYAYNKFSNNSLFRFKYVFSEYYDGTNIEELLKNSGGNVEIVFPNVDNIDIKASGLCEKLRGWGLTYKLTVFDSTERSKEFAEKLRRLNEDRNYRLWSDFGNYAPLYIIYAPYIIKSYYYNEDKGGEKTISYDLQSFDDFKYGYFPTHLDNYKGSVSVGISCGESGEMVNWLTKYFNEGDAVSKPLSKEYILENGYGEVLVYYPLEKFEGMDINKVGLMWCAMRSGVLNNRDMVRAEICGDYAVFLISVPDDMSFMLVDLDGREDYVPEYKRNRR